MEEILNSFWLEYQETIGHDGELLHASRIAINRRIAAEPRSDALGDQFRDTLGRLCANRVWEEWRAVFPEDTSPRDLALRCETVSGNDLARLQGELDSLRAHLEGKFILGAEYFKAIYAGFAWWAVARDSLDQKESRIGALPESESMPDEWSPCFLASLAATGGATWEDSNDPQLRSAYWIWFLTDAVAEALQVATAAER